MKNCLCKAAVHVVLVVMRISARADADQEKGGKKKPNSRKYEEV